MTTLANAQQEAYHAYDPASGIPEEQFTMEFINRKYPELLRPTRPQAPVQGILTSPKKGVELPPVQNRLSGILSPDYFQEAPVLISTKDKLKKKLLPEGYGYEKGQITTPSGFNFGKKGLGYSLDF